jgi:hypothetical protein
MLEAVQPLYPFECVHGHTARAVGGLTSTPKREIIIFVRRESQLLPANLTLFSPYLRIYSSLIIRKLPSAHSELLRGAQS